MLCTRSPSRCFILLVGIMLVQTGLRGQCLTSLQYQERAIAIENNPALKDEGKVAALIAIRDRFVACRLPADSVYARILHRLALYQFNQHGRVATKEVIDNTLTAFRINMANRVAGSKTFALNSCSNLGFYYKSIGLLRTAEAYLDSCIFLSDLWNAGYLFKSRSRIQKCEIFFARGDYQKEVNESSLGIIESREQGDQQFLLFFFNYRGQAYLVQKMAALASADTDSAMKYAAILHDSLEETNSIKIRAGISDLTGNPAEATRLFSQAIARRKLTRDFRQVADDYTDFGNFYTNRGRYSEAKACYQHVILYAGRINDGERLSKAHVNIGDVLFLEGKEEISAVNYAKAIRDIIPEAPMNVFSSPPAQRFLTIANKHLTLTILVNKTESMLRLFNKKLDTRYLGAALQCALLTDSVLTRVLHEQDEEQSKLFWRNITKEFYSHALEACWLIKDLRLAFYFMEKSRSVLLIEKLNELGASLKLPKEQASTEQNMQMKIISEQQIFQAMRPGYPGYLAQQAKLLYAKDAFDKFAKSLEQKYPVYYQYKYSNEVASLPELQSMLTKNHQSFVHYFIHDTSFFVLVSLPDSTFMQKISPSDFHVQGIREFLDYCANEQRLNRSYKNFLSLSQNMYRALFGPLHLPGGRVIICPDGFLIPFEALCKDSTSGHFLLQDYTFSYVYSAGYLLKRIENSKPKSDFAGFAPVRFRSGMELADLSHSSAAIRESGNYFHDKKIFLNQEASKRNFLEYVGNFTLALVFSHARADTSNIEPQLFMQDSVIGLSELGMIRAPATRLVVLSACQTELGKYASGEGIYSLSRGLAAAGIPAVAATLWQANDESIYKISRKFSENLSKGISKDEALRQAKLDFIAKAGKEKSLPYYWANLVLIGNPDAIEFLENKSSFELLGILVLGAGLLTVLIIFFLRYLGVFRTRK